MKTKLTINCYDVKFYRYLIEHVLIFILYFPNLEINAFLKA